MISSLSNRIIKIECVFAANRFYLKPKFGDNNKIVTLSTLIQSDFMIISNSPYFSLDNVSFLHYIKKDSELYIQILDEIQKQLEFPQHTTLS